ncbi:glycosyl transferase family 1 [Virgisporangium aliadipatigenens]|uniref:Glycosyl transferase family 1 n=1 Tax=Virgisporangium aliadipatigenens TaxID=741659 RepID=A0A8J4DTX5_9ACTN|nr:GNAT family N-acetyltransferase [Virgisporangium aliadipatigenens]GIJ49483.1 glycosyl transferase family 1 [Virgisporangium aliadipatigenens]
MSVIQRTTTGFTTKVIRDTDAFAALREEWIVLFGRCARATPFQSHAWLLSWWQVYGRPGALRVVTVRRDGQLVGAAPLYRTRRGGCAVLVPIGGALSDFADLLLDDACAPEAAEAMTTALLALRDWQVIDLHETRPRAMAGGVFATSWRGGARGIAASVCLELPSSPMDALVKELPAHTRKTVKRRVNQIAKLGVDVRPAPADESTRAVADLLRLHEAQWQGRGVNPEHLRPEFARHLSGALEGMVRAGEAAVLEYRIDGRHVVSNLVLIGPDLVGGYLFGALPELREKLDVTTLLIGSTLPFAHERGRPVMSMLRGAEPHKYRWRPAESQNLRLLFSRPRSPRAAVYVALVATKRRAVLYAKAKAPWVRQARDRVRALLSRRAKPSVPTQPGPPAEEKAP